MVQQELTFSNSEGSVTIGNSAPYWLKELNGVSGVTVNIEEQKAPFQDGTTHLSENFNNRFFNIVGVIRTYSDSELNDKKRELSSVFNPKLESTLTYTNGDYTKKITVWCEQTVLFSSTDKGNGYQTFLVNLRAHEPFWLDETISGEIMSLVIPAFKFTLAFDPYITFGEKGNNRTTIDNVGDVETPVRIEFEGPATNPKITNETTGEFVKVNTVLNTGEKLIITTDFGNKKVIFVDVSGNESNSFGLIDLNSKFFQLQIGENEISYSADVGTTTAEVLIQWYNRFLGL
jgi:hypothetical protein